MVGTNQVAGQVNVMAMVMCHLILSVLLVLVLKNGYSISPFNQETTKALIINMGLFNASIKIVLGQILFSRFFICGHDVVMAVVKSRTMVNSTKLV